MIFKTSGTVDPHILRALYAPNYSGGFQNKTTKVIRKKQNVPSYSESSYVSNANVVNKKVKRKVKRKVKATRSNKKQPKVIRKRLNSKIIKKRQRRKQNSKIIKKRRPNIQAIRNRMAKLRALRGAINKPKKLKRSQLSFRQQRSNIKDIFQ